MNVLTFLQKCYWWRRRIIKNKKKSNNREWHDITWCCSFIRKVSKSCPNKGIMKNLSIIIGDNETYVLRHESQNIVRDHIDVLMFPAQFDHFMFISVINYDLSRLFKSVPSDSERQLFCSQIIFIFIFLVGIKREIFIVNTCCYLADNKSVPFFFASVQKTIFCLSIDFILIFSGSVVHAIRYTMCMREDEIWL